MGCGGLNGVAASFRLTRVSSKAYVVFLTKRSEVAQTGSRHAKTRRREKEGDTPFAPSRELKELRYTRADFGPRRDISMSLVTLSASRTPDQNAPMTWRLNSGQVE